MLKISKWILCTERWVGGWIILEYTKYYIYMYYIFLYFILNKNKYFK